MEREKRKDAIEKRRLRERRERERGELPGVPAIVGAFLEEIGKKTKVS